MSAQQRHARRRRVVWAAIAGITAAMCAGLVGVDYVACHAKWDGSGMRARFGVMSGCMIETQPGRWIPAKSYRETL